MTNPKTFRTLTSRTPFLAASLLVAFLGACSASIAVEPIGAGTDASIDTSTPDVSTPDVSAPDSATPDSSVPDAGPVLPLPVSPYVAAVATTDVSILYPLPVAGQSTAFVRPGEAGVYGPLLAKSTFDATTGGKLDLNPLPGFTTPSSFDQLALIGIRIDPCSARKGSGCASEVRLIFQALYTRPAGGEAPGATAALDGAVHAMYDIPSDELTVLMKQLLTLKAANGGLQESTLGVHPILAAQGLGGSFATGLRQLLLEHLGNARLARVTTFDHHNNDEDAWAFKIFDVVNGVPAARKISPGNVDFGQTVVGASAMGIGLGGNTPSVFPAATVEDISLLFASSTTPNVTIQDRKNAFEAAVRVENPTVHTAESVECATCHLAGAGKDEGRTQNGFTSTNEFKHARPLTFVTQRTSATNLHAFGYLERQISIMQRTANESVVVATAMEAKVQ